MNLIERVKKHTSRALSYVVDVTAEAAQYAAESESVVVKAFFMAACVLTVLSVAVVTAKVLYSVGLAMWGVCCP